MKLVKPSFEIWAAYDPKEYHDLPYDYWRWGSLIEDAARVCYKSENKKWLVCPQCKGEMKKDCPVCQGIYENSADKMIAMLKKNNHHAMFEHSWAVIRQNKEWGSPPNRTKHLLMNCQKYDKKRVLAPEYNYLYAGNHRALKEAGIKEYYHPVYKQIPDYMKAMTVKFICDRGVSHELVRHRPASFAQESTRYCNYGGGVTYVIPPWVELDEGEYTCIKNLPGWVKKGTLTWYLELLRNERLYQIFIDDGWKPEQARTILPNCLKTEIVVTASLQEWKHIFKLRCAKAAHPQMREIMIPLQKRARELYPDFF